MGLRSCRPSQVLAAILLLFGVVWAAPPPALTVTPITKLADIASPPTNPGRPACMVRIDTASGESLTGQSALIVTGTASSAYDAAVASQYLTDRGATVDYYCTSDLPQHNVLSEGYLPKFTISGCASTVPKGASAYDIVVVASGYSAILPMREPSHPFQTFLGDFMNPAQNNKTRTLVVVGGAADVIIAQEALFGSVISSGLGLLLPTGLSLSFKSALQHCLGVSDKSSAECVALQPKSEGEPPQQQNITTEAVLQPLASTPLFIAVASSSDALLELLMDVSVTVFRKDTMDVTPFNCSEAAESTNLVLPAAFADVTDATLATLTAQTNTASTVLNVSLAEACLNKERNNFCANTPVSLVVANGAHDQSVITAINALAHVGPNLRVFCPDSDESTGVVYLMPEPSTAPSFSLSCTTYLNESDLVRESIVIIVTGPQATHGFLAANTNVLSVLQFTGTYSLAGTALVLLLGLKSREDVFDVPRSPFTDNDLTIAGYNATSLGQDGQNIFWYRNPSLKRAKVLAGYSSAANVMSSGFDLFLQQTIQLIVWNAVDDSKNYDTQVVGAWLGVGLAAVIGVFLLKCRKRERAVTYQRVAPSEERSIPAVYPAAQF